ncbi:hypothetical protein L1887_54004 [Cichorium endivia]|nr:hypothetical protein L1887_54004 [Cichorium endivia]
MNVIRSLGMLAKASSADEGRTASSEVHPSCREEIECVVGDGGGDALLSLVAGSVTCAGSRVRKRCCSKTKGWRATAKRAGEEVVVEEREDRVELSWTSLWSRSQRSSALRNPRREKVAAAAAAAEHNTRALTCSCRTVVIDRCLHQRRCTTACHSRFEKHSSSNFELSSCESGDEQEEARLGRSPSLFHMRCGVVMLRARCCRAIVRIADRQAQGRTDACPSAAWISSHLLVHCQAT